MKKPQVNPHTQGFRHKNIAKEKEKIDARNRAIEEQRKRILEYTKSLPEAPAMTEAAIVR